MNKYLYFLLFLFVSCSPTSTKLIDDYYIYSPDDYYDSYYLKCKLSNSQDPVIDNVYAVYWNDSTIIIKRKKEKYDWWIIKASGSKLKCCNNDTIIGPVSEYFIKGYMTNEKFNKLVFN